jgi:hypothetical protein
VVIRACASACAVRACAGGRGCINRESQQRRTRKRVRKNVRIECERIYSKVQSKQDLRFARLMEIL